MEMMNSLKKVDRELILSDELICAVLSVEAESVGASLEDYVDRFLDAFYEEPERFNLLIK